MAEVNLANVKARINQYINEYRTGNATKTNSRLKGAAITLVADMAGGDAKRRAIFEALTGAENTIKMNEAHWYAIMKMVDPREVDGEWVGRPGLFDIIQAILYEIPVQEELPLMGPPSGIAWDEIKKVVDSERTP